MRIGFDYYPEHWKESRWDTDLKLMQKGGFNVVRLAEFAWVFMEPEEGVYNFDWLDRALAKMNDRGISAILGTPTAVMPAWLAKKYPETLLMEGNGRRLVWGVRKNNCFSSETYRSFSRKITLAMAEHFKNTPNVIGWQTDNEFGSPFCYCKVCQTEFQAWLKKKYGTLAALNKAMGTHFWGHKYGQWDEIQLPVDDTSYNPSLLLDWHRFNSWLNVRFQHEQVEVLREVCPKHFITHNFMGLYNNLNYYDLAADLDFVSWDNYPVWGPPEISYGASMAADVMRGLKRKNFWIMEQTAGPGGWGCFGRNPRPGEIRKVSYQQLARGADAQIWFRWRSCTAGREQYWHGILGHDGKALRRYDEAAQVSKEYHKMAKDLEGTTLKPKVAMIYDYESHWALKFQAGFGENNPHKVMHRYYNALFRAGVSVDMVRPDQDLSQYKIVLAPDLYIMPDKIANSLNEFVRKGGILLADCRTAVKDENNLCHERTLPGLLSKSLGISIEEYEALAKGMEYPVIGGRGLPGKFTAVDYTDWVTPVKAESIAGYEMWHMKKFAAVTKNFFGKGLGYYVGTVVMQDAFYDALIAELLKSAKINPVVRPPAGVETTIREGKGRKLLFLINHLEEDKVVNVPRGKKELISGRTTGESLRLEKYGVAVIRL